MSLVGDYTEAFLILTLCVLSISVKKEKQVNDEQNYRCHDSHDIGNGLVNAEAFLCHKDICNAYGRHKCCRKGGN